MRRVGGAIAATSLLLVVASSACAPDRGTGAPTTTIPAPPAPATVAVDAQDGGDPAGEITTVTEIVDGDTVRVEGDRSVRLIGIDTPETRHPDLGVQCYGREASGFLATVIPPGTEVRLVSDVEATDRYGRTLAYVYRAADGLFVNRHLLLEGYAQVATFPPNVAHVDELLAAQREARDAGRGLWSACEDELDLAPDVTSGTGTSAACDPAYPDVCLPSPPPDLDCVDLDESDIVVLPPDPHRLDGDGDGRGCAG